MGNSSIVPYIPHVAWKDCHACHEQTALISKGKVEK
jgi:hypothetical protein